MNKSKQCSVKLPAPGQIGKAERRAEIRNDSYRQTKTTKLCDRMLTLRLK